MIIKGYFMIIIVVVGLIALIGILRIGRDKKIDCPHCGAQIANSVILCKNCNKHIIKTDPKVNARLKKWEKRDQESLDHLKRFKS